MSTMTPAEKAAQTQQQHDTWPGDSTEHYGSTDVPASVQQTVLCVINEMTLGIVYDPRFAEDVVDMLECMPRAALEQMVLTVCIAGADLQRKLGTGTAGR